MGRRLRVGLVGYGEIARFHERHLRSAGADIAGVVTRGVLPPGLRRYPALGAMLAEVDAVTIAVPNHLHGPLCVEALRAGVAVFVEKPLAMTVRELEMIRECSSRSGVPLRVGFRLRWNPALVALRERLRRPRRLRCVYRLGIGRLARGKDWTRREAESGGAAFTLGVHAFDLVRWLSRCRGEPTAGLEAVQAGRGTGADFPLSMIVRGVVGEGDVRVEAGADLRGEVPFDLQLAVEAEAGSYTDATLPRPFPEDDGAAEVEYRAMLADFVEAASTRAWNESEVAELIRCHLDLVTARELATRAERPGR